MVPQAGQGASVSYSTTQPVPATDDIANFTGSDRDRDNILGDGSSDGGANDAGTYLATDRPHQGQTFTTGSAAGGYHVTAVWLKHAAYAGNAASTWWQTSGGSQLTVRITDPAAAGSGGFALGSETAVLTGTEDGTPNDLAPRSSVTNSTTGTGVWVRFALDSPVNLDPNREYGFDVSSNTSGLFFETHGIRDAASGGNPYAGGEAYNGGTNGSSDDAMNPVSGDRVFMVEITEGMVVPVDTTPYAAPRVAAGEFPLDRVRLLDSRFKDNQELHRTGYLAWLDPDRLLHPYRVNAGLPTNGSTSLGGWDGDEGTSWGANACRGHMLGHYLSAAAAMYAATGDASYVTKIQYLVTELKACQDALGVQELAAGRVYGYLGGIQSSHFTTLETNPTSALVPFYTIHKTFAGLIDVYRYCGIDQALDIAIDMADYHRWRIDQLSTAQIEAMFRTDNGNSEEWGGMNEALTNIYLLSRERGDGNPERHLEFAQVFHRDWFIDPLEADLDQLNGLHANTHVPQVVGFAHSAAVLNEADPERDRLYAASNHFWHMVTGEHSFCLGGNSYAEHFSTPGLETGAGGSSLSWNTAETCNTYNMLKLTGELFQHDPVAEYADFYERALYNHILASFAPDTGMATYFVALQSGRFKTYGLPEGSCWCCTGTGLENPAIYSKHIYFHKDDTLWVNLFVPSTLDWAEQGMSVRMDTGFPASDTIQITLHGGLPTPAKVRLRIPQWIASAPTVLVNGIDQGVSATAGSYVEVDRSWADGDVITLTLPMAVHLDRSMDDPSQVSLFYGPVLLAGDLGTDGMPVSDETADQWDHQSIAMVPAPSLVAANAGDLPNWVHPGTEALTFTADASFAGDERRGTVDLKPFYDTHHTRYAVYWNLVAPEQTSSWSGAGGLPDWSDGANWDVAPAAGNALWFSAAAGGFPSNDLVPGDVFGGVDFPPAAGPFVVGGNGIGLRGDVRNLSSLSQRIDTPLALQDSLPWRFDTAGGDLVVGGAVTGSGSIHKVGSHDLLLLGNCGFGGSLCVDEGSVEVGNGGTSGSLGDVAVSLAAGGELVIHRSDDVSLQASITGEGTFVKRGTGSLNLDSPSSIGGSVVVESGKLQFGSRQVQRLLHRWSFNGNLLDTAGGADALLVDAGSNNATLGANAVTLAGGTRSDSDYVSLGAGLLPKDGSAVTLEFWATQHSLRTWSRIFDVGSSTSENLFMSWSQTTSTTDRVEWKDDGVTGRGDHTVAPYTFDTEFHILLVIEPGTGGAATTVTWYAAPGSSPDLGPSKGSFETNLAIADLNDADFWLGRSQYDDQTANASYNEVRVWNRSFSGADLEALHDLGPDSVGSFSSETISGSLAGVPDVTVGSGAEFDIGAQAVELGSLTGGADSVIRFGGGSLRVAAGGDDAVVFGGAFVGTGSVVNDGTLRLSGTAAWPAGVSLVNHGLLDIMTWRGELPENFVNDGVVLGRNLVKVDDIAPTGNDVTIRIHGYRGHAYRLQRADDLASGIWHDAGEPVDGADADIEFTDVDGAMSVRRFYRVSVSP